MELQRVGTSPPRTRALGLPPLFVRTLASVHGVVLTLGSELWFACVCESTLWFARALERAPPRIFFARSLQGALRLFRRVPQGALRPSLMPIHVGRSVRDHAFGLHTYRRREACECLE